MIYCYLFPLLHIHTCVMAHSLSYYKYLFIYLHLSLWPLCKFLVHSWNCGWPFLLTFFPQHYTHNWYSGMLLQWIMIIFPNLKTSFWTRLTSELQKNNQLFRLLGWVRCSSVLRKVEFKCSVKFLLNSGFYK